jgi:ribose transport system substrate-binding protein
MMNGKSIKGTFIHPITRMRNLNMKRSKTAGNQSLNKRTQLFDNQYLLKQSPLPLYHQLKEILLKYVKNNSEGTYLPTEIEIGEYFKISRPTVRQALKELENDGHITREKGKGTYVGKKSPNISQAYNATYGQKIYVPLSSSLKKVQLNNKKIGISLFTHKSGYFNILRDNIVKTLSEFGVTEFLCDANDNADVQNAQIDGFVNNNVDLIIIDPVSPPSALISIFEKVYHFNIPVISVNSHLDVNSKYLAYVGCDNFELGVRSGIYIGSYLKKKYNGDLKGKIAVIEGDPGNIAGMERGKGLATGLHRIGKMSDLEIVEKESGNWSYERGEEAAKKIFRKHRSLDFIYAYSDSMALGAINAANTLGRSDVVFSSIDGSKDALRNIIEGGPLKSIGLNDPIRIGKLAAEIAVSFLSLGIVPSNTVLIEPILITQENVSAFYDPESPF